MFFCDHDIRYLFLSGSYLEKIYHIEEGLTQKYFSKITKKEILMMK
ncbi:hypothetical protein CIRMBP1248_02218 [Enterococcus cecorum]|nr:hypothetical protein CIRMBP1248_02218 [Enterococcus cecorum]CAI3475450.1 hypothetical protein CIRMBP1256_02119 [Enterococcus cecorum]CAI3501001.1 hypothetical protein CIRMBP1295_01966 [Enterococcus cecorum]CAI3512686.1 hypothetical protein CIRMBP1287_00838 [Enterococcus cecorum]